MAKQKKRPAYPRRDLPQGWKSTPEGMVNGNKAKFKQAWYPQAYLQVPGDRRRLVLESEEGATVYQPLGDPTKVAGQVPWSLVLAAKEMGLETVAALEQTGWGVEVDEHFLLGDTLLVPLEEGCTLPGDWFGWTGEPDARPVFRPIMAPWVDEFGTLARWLGREVKHYNPVPPEARMRGVLDVLGAHPRLMVAALASLAAPMLRVLDARPFGVEFSGPALSGKSLAVAAAASVWGRHSGHTGPVYSIQNPKWTAATENLVATRNDLPTCLLRGPATRKVMEAALAGMGQFYEGARWSTVVIAEGSQFPTTQEDAPSGDILTLWGPTLLGNAREQATAATAAWSTFQQSAGWGRFWIGVLLDTIRARGIGMLMTWRAIHGKQVEAFQKLAEGPEALAQAHHVGTLGTVAELSEALAIFPEGSTKPAMDDLRHYLVHLGQGSGSRAETAHGRLLLWLAKQDNAIQRPGRASTTEQEWIGVERFGITWVFARLVADWLTFEGYRPKDILREWAARGLIVVQQTGPGFTRPQKIAGKWVQCLGVKPGKE